MLSSGSLKTLWRIFTLAHEFGTIFHNEKMEEMKLPKGIKCILPEGFFKYMLLF
jgi:hypothetical protein